MMMMIIRKVDIHMLYLAWGNFNMNVHVHAHTYTQNLIKKVYVYIENS